MARLTNSFMRLLVIVAFSFIVGTVSAPRPAYALFDSVPIVHAIMEMQAVLNGTLSAFQSMVNLALGQINGVLGPGFAQLSNYMKAQVGAQEQIADANNMVNARLARDVRNSEQRNNHAVNRQDCLNLEGGQAAVVAARKGDDVAAALDSGKSARAEAHKGTPAWEGAGQAQQAANNNHFSLYCSDAEADAGVCTLASQDQRDADQNASSLLTPPVYVDKQAITRANDYATTLIQPSPPAAPRGSSLTSIEGQGSLPGRRSYNAAITLAEHVTDGVLGWHANTVSLSSAQKAEATREGITNTDAGSEYEATDLEINRKYSGTDWQADLQAMPAPKSVLVQIALLDAQRNWILWQQYKLEQQRALMEATRLSIEAERRLRPVTPMPVPTSTLN